MAHTVEIGKYKIGREHAPLIVAEISANHNGSLENAIAIVDKAHVAGVHAIKLQTYTADTMTLDVNIPPFLIDNPSSLWYGKSLYKLYQEAYTPWEWHKPIFDHCKKLGLIAFSTPFDRTSFDFLESLNVPCYKTASSEILDHELIHDMAKTKKPLIISTGAATLLEIEEAVKVAKEAGCKDMILLKCTLSYPAKPESMNLVTIPHLEEAFSLPVGISDHSLGIGAAIASISHGACYIEKHMTLSREEGGVDSAFSLEPHEMAMLVEESKRAWLSQGTIHYGPLDSESASYVHRRSLFFVKDIKQGETITREHLRAIRPAAGMHPKHIKDLIGKKAACDVKRATPASWDLIL